MKFFHFSFLVALFPSSSMLQTLKATIRNDVKQALKSLSKESIQFQSEEVTKKVFALPEVLSSRSTCIYLSMDGEIDTCPILKRLFEMNKNIFIPKVIGKEPTDMRMFELQSYEQLVSFPKSRWGIPEPPINLLNVNDESYLETIDVVFVPGVAFDASCGRVGHGKGYYDCFLNKLISTKKSQSLQEPVIIGLGLEEQLISHCPMDDHDVNLQYVITATDIFRRKV